MAINPLHKGALTVGKQTVTGRAERIESRKPLVAGDYYDRCAVSSGSSVRKGRAAYIANRNP